MHKFLFVAILLGNVLFSAPEILSPVKAVEIIECAEGADGPKLASYIDRFQQCPVGTDCYTKLDANFGEGIYFCHKFSSEYIQKSCNTTITIDQINDCTPGTNRSYAVSCGVGGKGFTCSNPVRESLCMNGEKKPENVVCEYKIGNTPVCDPAKDPTCTGGYGKFCDTGSGNEITSGDGIMTAVGCIPTKPQALVEGLLRYGMLAGGGIAFLLMILAALQMITAEGNPDAIKQGQEKFYSAIIGLLIIIFSVLLLQVIGVDILDLPDFNKAAP